MGFSGYGSVKLPIQMLGDFDIGFRVFVPDDYIPYFLIDFFASYPSIDIGSLDVPKCTALYGIETPSPEHGSWFHCDNNECFFASSKSKSGYITIHLEDIWQSLRMPRNESAFPLDLTQIYS